MGQQFFGRLWPEARAVSDWDKIFYDAFGIRHANLNEMAGPNTVMCAMRATVKGNFVTGVVGDPYTMPGIMFIRHQQILWSHNAQNIGDHPDWKTIPRIAHELE